MTAPPLPTGTSLLEEAVRALGIDVAVLVSRCAVWANPTIVAELSRHSLDAVWYPATRRLRRGESRRALVNGVRLDDNSLANAAIKLATFGVRTLHGFHACHVWPGTCYNPRYHTAICNLVLVPAPLAGLTDHDPVVAASLRRRSFDLFGWHPAGVDEPAIPPGYPTPGSWRPVDPITPVVKSALARRIRHPESV